MKKISKSIMHLKYYLLFNVAFAISVIGHSQTYYPAGLPKSKINIWLDASDASTITTASGAVTKWTDKVNGLQAISPSTSNSPIINTTLLSGKNLIEFQGTKVLNIADNPLLNPTNGFNLAQVVYVHPDASTTYNTATDFRIGTYARNESPVSNAPIGTASITVKYVNGINDNRYRIGLTKNSSGTLIGANNNSVPDLAGTWNLFENYLTWTNRTDTAIVVQLNSGLKISNPYAFLNSTQSVGIGNKYNNPASVHWSIGETVLAGVPLGSSGKNILDCYLANKWGLAANLSTTVQNLYNAPSATFTNNLVGIGTEGGVDSIAGTASNNGLGFINVSGNSGFLREAGDYMLAADNAATGTGSIGTGFTKWNRTWFINKTDAVGYGGNLNVFFDFTTYGISSALDTVANSYYLLFNPTSSSFNSGNNYLISAASYQQFAGRKQLAFLVDAINTANGYYTIVYAAKGTAVTNIPLLTGFISPILNISPAPFINKVVAGNTYNYLFLNTDSINYNIAYFKIFAGANGAAPILIDSVTPSNKFYAHYNLTNAVSYQYYAKAVYALGKESQPSNYVTATPGIVAPVWQTTPQYAGNGKVFMLAKTDGQNTPLKYYFDCSAGGGHASDYQANSSYTDVSLVNGNTYTYRYKTMDSTKGSSTESGLSLPVSVLLVDSAKGGFAYKFAFADNNTIAIPNGIGPSLYNPTTIDTTGLRFIKHAPAYGIHPRIYCNPEDSTSIRFRFQNTNSGRALAKYIHNFTILLQLGYNPGTYSLSANYAGDTLGNTLLTNVGAASVKPIYDSLAAGDIGVTNNYNNLWRGNAGKMANILSYEAFECWLFKGTVDPVTNTSYTVRAAKLAKAMSIWAQKALADNKNPLSFNNRDRFGSLQMAMMYDFLYDQMTTNQRDSVRMGLVAIALRDSMDLHLVNSPSYTIMSNWSTFGFEIMPLLAIEGEAGYTKRNENALQAYCRVVLNFLNYGFYSQTGGPVEGIGKNQINPSMLTALARRGYSMLGHPAVKAFAKKYYPAVLQPFGYSMLGTDLLGGTGTFNNGQYVSASQGGWKPLASLDMIGFKWIFPNDTTVDFLWKNYAQRTHAAGPTAPYSYYYQNLLSGSLGQSGYWNYLSAAVFVSDYSTTPFLTQAQSVYGNNRMYFDSLGGFAVMRSGYDTLSAALFYHNRQDLGGHTVANKNDIVYSALGRIWIPRVSSNGNSNYPLLSTTGVASSILINNTSQSVDSANLGIQPIPGKIVYYKNTPAFQCIAGDAKDAYSYAWKSSFGGYKGDNPSLGGIYSKLMKTLNSYRYTRNYGFDDIPMYNQLTQGDYSWAAGAHYQRTVSKPWLNGVVKKVFRTVAMVTDASPYVIVADDVQRDNNINNYKWIAQLPNDLTIENTMQNLTDNNYRNDIIFKEPAATGNRRFLVRILNNTGAVNATVPAYVDSITNPISGASPNNKLPRLVVESNSIDPKFKIMLFAYNNGDVLPVTSWNTDHSRLLVVNNSATNTIVFPVDSAGRTNIQLISGNILPTTITLAATIVNQNKVNISWKALEQQDIASYQVERSWDAATFQPINTVSANGNITADYNFIDNAPLNGSNYYRIKIINKNGSISYSNVAVINLSSKAFIQVSPNPVANNNIVLQTKNILVGKYALTLYNSLGQSVLQQSINITTPNQNIQLLGNALEGGTYHLILQNDANIFSTHFVKN